MSRELVEVEDRDSNGVEGQSHDPDAHDVHEHTSGNLQTCKTHALKKTPHYTTKYAQISTAIYLKSLPKHYLPFLSRKTTVRAHHVINLDVTIGEGNGIGRRGHWDHEGIGSRDSGWYHEVQRVNAEINSLKITTQNDNHKDGEKREGLLEFSESARRELWWPRLKSPL